MFIQVNGGVVVQGVDSAVVPGAKRTDRMARKNKPAGRYTVAVAAGVGN